jgi:hypothetical protein
MAKERFGSIVLGALAFGSHLSPFEFMVVVGLVVLWLAPNWLRKLIVLADELLELIEKLRHFRSRWRRAHSSSSDP